MTAQMGAQRRVQAAVRELKDVILAAYPNARFRLVRSADEWQSWNLWTMVDVDDLDVVSDLVGERTLTMRVEEGIPLHVVPVRNLDIQTGMQSSDVERAG